MDSIEAKEYFLDKSESLIQLAEDSTQRNSFVFLLCSAMIEYLTRLTHNRTTNGNDYSEFIKQYFPSEYRDFKYKSGKRDLPEQMYYVLRCGLVHSFSLIPDERSRNSGGRIRSIVLTHRDEAEAHLSNTAVDNLDAAIFVAEDFCADLKNVVEILFEKSKKDQDLHEKMNKWLNDHPPIKGGFQVSAK